MVLQRCNLFFCCQGYLKHFLEKFDFVENLEMKHIAGGREAMLIKMTELMANKEN